MSYVSGKDNREMQHCFGSLVVEMGCRYFLRQVVFIVAKCIAVCRYMIGR